MNSLIKFFFGVFFLISKWKTHEWQEWIIIILYFWFDQKKNTMIISHLFLSCYLHHFVRKLFLNKKFITFETLFYRFFFWWLVGRLVIMIMIMMWDENKQTNKQTNHVKCHNFWQRKKIQSVFFQCWYHQYGWLKVFFLKNFASSLHQE